MPVAALPRPHLHTPVPCSRSPVSPPARARPSPTREQHRHRHDQHITQRPQASPAPGRRRGAHRRHSRRCVRNSCHPGLRCQGHSHQPGQLPQLRHRPRLDRGRITTLAHHHPYRSASATPAVPLSGPPGARPEPQPQPNPAPGRTTAAHQGPEGAMSRPPVAGRSSYHNDVCQRLSALMSIRFSFGVSLTCRNEYFICAHFYARPGILSQVLATSPTMVVQPFPLFW